MKVKVHLPGALDGEITAKDVSHKKVDLAQLEVEPYFYKPDGKPAVFYLETLDGSSNVIKRYALLLSGTNGELQLIRRTACKPAIDIAATGTEE